MTTTTWHMTATGMNRAGVLVIAGAFQRQTVLLAS
jgi:hypothetical protein